MLISQKIIYNRLRLSSFGLLIGCLSSYVNAADFSLKPTIGAGIKYTDNLFLNDDDKRSDWRGTISPGLNLGYSIKNFSLDAFASADINRYVTESDVDTEDQFYRLKSQYSMGRSDLNFSINYNKITTLRTEQVDTGLLNSARQRKTLQISPSWLYRLSERTNITLGYAHQERSYTGSSSGSTQTLVGTEQNGGNIMVNYKIDDRTKVGGDLSYVNTQADNGRISDSLLLRFPISYDYSETFRAGLIAGARYTITSNEDKGSSGDAGFLFELEVRKKFDIGKVDFSLERSVYPSGSGALTQKDQVLLNLTANLSDTISASFMSRYLRRESIGEDNSNDSGNKNREFLSLGPVLRWQWSSNWSVNGGYIFSSQDNKDLSGKSNTVFVNVGYAFEELFLPD